MAQKNAKDTGVASGSGDGLGDAQGTRVGAPDQSESAPNQHSDSPSGRPERRTGMGSEASEGMHNAQGGGRSEEENTGLESAETGRGGGESSKRAGSEPLAEDGDQHRSGYGGAGGKPVTSSDTREPKKPR